MLSSNKIGFKRLKRKRKIQGRIACHGNKQRCHHQNYAKKEIKEEKAEKIFWLKRLLYGIIKRFSNFGQKGI